MTLIPPLPVEVQLFLLSFKSVYTSGQLVECVASFCTVGKDLLYPLELYSFARPASVELSVQLDFSHA